jgi:D-alanyl-D-alanine carboxypeptidase/D-alanyl-D-alanine-endopeptidase (penicillin-binding protein 4)
MGIRKIQGNIIIDDTAFDHIPYPVGWLWNDLSSVFAAPLNTVVINRNKFGVSIIPARRLGEKPEIVPQLPPGSATFINQAKTTNYPCPVTILSNQNNQYLIRGCIPKKSGVEHRSLAIRNMEMFTRGLIPELLHKQQIELNGHFLSQKTPPNAQLATEHVSAPLKELIVHLLKKSDNLYADVLFKKIGEYYGHAPGSWQNGLQAEAPVLSRKVGINLNHIRLIDGAGLSQYNLATPYDISQMLNYIQHNPTLRETLIPALPIAGVDGTLRFRMPKLARGELVHAKTGSMTGVSTLAGFVKTKHHGTLSFVIMINNIPKYRIPYIALENNIVEFLANSSYC